MRYALPLLKTLERLRDHGFPAHARDIPGVSSRQWRAAIEAGLVLRLRRGIVMPSEVWRLALPDERHRWALNAALLAYPGAWASHTSALRTHGVRVLSPRDMNGHPMVHISRTGTYLREPGLVVHNVEVAPDEITNVDGVNTCGLVRASIEVASRRPLAPAVAVLDASMRMHIENLRLPHLRTSVHSAEIRAGLFDEWDQAAGKFSRHRWVTTVRQAIRWADPAAESYLESISRVAMRDQALPMPEIGSPMLGDNDCQYWLDFWWEAYKVIGEADGLFKYEDGGQLLEEKLRQEALSPRGTFVRWGVHQVQPDPAAMIDRIYAAFGDRSPKRMEWVDLGQEAA